MTVTVTLPPLRTGDKAYTLAVPVLQSEVLRDMTEFIDQKANLLELPLEDRSCPASEWRQGCWDALRTWSLYCNYLRMHHGVGTEGNDPIHRLLSRWRGGVMDELRLAIWMFDKKKLDPLGQRWPPAPSLAAELRDQMEADVMVSVNQLFVTILGVLMCR